MKFGIGAVVSSSLTSFPSWTAQVSSNHHPQIIRDLPACRLDCYSPGREEYTCHERPTGLKIQWFLPEAFDITGGAFD